MFMGADLSLCVQGRQDRKTVSRKEREGWSYGELVQRCNWYLSRKRFLLPGVQQITQGAACFQTTLTRFLILFSCGFHFEAGTLLSLFTCVWNFLLVNCMTKGAQPTSAENKILSCVDKLFSPNLVAARYVCGLVFCILFTYLHLFPHPSTHPPPPPLSLPFFSENLKQPWSLQNAGKGQQIADRKKERKRWSERYGQLTQAAINICRCEVRGMIV